MLPTTDTKLKLMQTATELIWIFDQYFWSEPVGRLLNYQVRNNSGLCVLVILPPHADSTYPEEHRARQLALQELTLGLSADQLARVAVYNMWHPQGKGIYVHAKAHTYDGALMVCGSANLNRRSLTCDSELACAVVDADVVAAHQQNLAAFPDNDSDADPRPVWIFPDVRHSLTRDRTVRP